LNEPGLGAGIYPGMALTPFPSSIDEIRTHILPIVGRKVRNNVPKKGINYEFESTIFSYLILIIK